MSIEALAMAGADYIKCGINLQELEREDLEKTPQHLLAEQRHRNKSEENERDKMPLEKWQEMKEDMEAWAKAVPTFNVFLLQFSGLERATNLHPQGNVKNRHDISTSNEDC